MIILIIAYHPLCCLLFFAWKKGPFALSIVNVCVMRFIMTSQHNLSQQITTTVDHDNFQAELLDVYPWWYIVIAVFVLLLIWLLIFVVLWFCGFFDRWRFVILCFVILWFVILCFVMYKVDPLSRMYDCE